ncbi:MAG: hypothetical protein KDA62_05880 [Planctomycetales bacterium]|nr:hypothetical protein [Planctomycetales bacterium]
MSWILFLASVVAAPGNESTAANSTYDVAVCLRVSDSPQFTPLYRENLRQQIEGQLNSFFGAFAQVSVLSSGHPLIDEYRGRPASEPADVDELWDRLPHEKTLIATVDFRQQRYQVELRELDRERRQETPVYHGSTPDRLWLAKSICLAIKDHLALVAEITPGTFTNSVAIQFRGDQHRQPLVNMLGESSVMQPYWVLRRRDGSRVRHPIPNTLLRVHPNQSLNKADVITSRNQPWARTAAVVGFEAIKVTTQPGRIRLRLVDAATGDPVIQCNVLVNDSGFDKFSAGDNVGSPDRDGYVTVPRSLRGVAFVKVSQGSTAVIQVPLPIDASFAEHEIKVPVDSEPGKRMEFDRRLRFLMQDVQTLAAMQSDAFREVNQLNSKDNKQYEQALTRAEQTTRGVAPLLIDAKDRFRVAVKDVETLNLQDARIPYMEEQLKRIEDQHRSLGELANNLKEAIDTREAGKRAKVLLDLARQAEQEGDIDEALARYQLAQDELEQPQVTARMDSIRKLWDITNSPKRQTAHNFIYNEWANAELTEIKTLLPRVEDAFATLKADGDYLRGWKLIRTIDAHLADLGALVDQLSLRAGDGDEELGTYQQLTQDLAELQERVATFVAEASAAEQPPAEPAAANNAPAAAGNANPPPATNAPPAKSPLEEEEEEEPR